jgi:hypothetical protein
MYLEKQAEVRCNRNILPQNIKNRSNYIERQMSVSKIMKKSYLVSYWEMKTEWAN